MPLPRAAGARATPVAEYSFIAAHAAFAFAAHAPVLCVTPLRAALRAMPRLLMLLPTVICCYAADIDVCAHDA